MPIAFYLLILLISNESSSLKNVETTARSELFIILKVSDASKDALKENKKPMRLSSVIAAIDSVLGQADGEKAAENIALSMDQLIGPPKGSEFLKLKRFPKGFIGYSTYSATTSCNGSRHVH